jgi:acetylornithine/N-succinyldiaminopimelate aminotransferase
MELFDVYSINQININKAKGSYVWDDLGNQYLDMYGGHAVVSIGHLHHHWQKAISDQLQNIAFYSNSVIIPMQQKLAELLGRVSGKYDYRLFLCNSGAEANENAIKLASFHNQRKKVVAFSGGFHGRTSLAVACTDNPSIIAPANETENVIKLPFNDIESLQNCFKTYGNEISSVIVEGIQGVGGIIEADIAFLLAIRSLCDQYNAVYIADSVQCGYGRTGQFFAHDIAGVSADIYTMAKGMGNGFPIGGIICAPKFEARKGMLGTTFGGNHLACVAAISVLEVIEKENLLTNAQTEGDFLIQGLKALPQVKTIRGRGLMIGFEMIDTHSNLKKELLEKSRIFTGEAKNNVIRLLPSLAISRKDCQQFLTSVQTLIDNK